MVSEPTAAVPIVSPDGRIVVYETAEGFAFRPAHRWVARNVVAMLAFGILVPLVGIILVASSWIGPAGPPLWFIVIGATVCGAVGLVAGAYFWRFKAVPLIAQKSGRVAYGSRVLLEPGATRRLHIIRIDNSEDPDHFVVVAENRWGPLLRFETPYIDEFRTYESADWFAAKLGSVIGAEVVKDEPSVAAVDGGV